MKEFIEFMVVLIGFFFWGSVFLFLLIKLIQWFNPDCRNALKLFRDEDEE